MDLTLEQLGIDSWGGNIWSSANGADWKRAAIEPGNAFEAITVGTPAAK